MLSGRIGWLGSTRLPRLQIPDLYQHGVAAPVTAMLLDPRRVDFVDADLYTSPPSVSPS